MTDDLDDLKAMMQAATPRANAAKRAANIAARCPPKTLCGSRKW